MGIRTIESIKKSTDYRSLIVAMLYLIVFGILVLPLPLILSHKLLIVSIFLTFYLSINKFSISLNYYYLAFLCISFLSYFFAIYPSLVTFPIFIIVLNGLWMAVSKSIFQKVDLNRSFRLYSYIGLFTALLIIIGHVIEIAVDSWVKFFFAGNHNYLLSLSTFLLVPFSFSSGKMKYINYLMLLVVLILALFNDSVGTFILVILLFVYKIVDHLLTEKKLNYLFILSFVTIIILPFTISIIELNQSYIQRINQITLSYHSWLQRPLFGHGLGNWIYAVLEQPDIFKSEQSIFFVDNHNYPTKILTEMGMVGFIFYYLFIIQIIYKKFKRKLTIIEKTALIYALGYLILSNIYRVSFSNEPFISGIEILAFTSFGLLDSSE